MKMMLSSWPQRPAADTTPNRVPWLRRSLLQLGLWPSVAVLTLAVAISAAALAQVVASLLGAGQHFAAPIVAAIVSLLLAPLFGLPLVRLVFDLESQRRGVAESGTLDSLTGLTNRSHFMHLAEREWARARRYGTDAALLVIDGDHFGRINDRHGRECGDELLRGMARTAAASLRQPDVLARFAGAELIVFLPQTDPLGALDVAERIRCQVQALRVSWQGRQVGTTVSIGVAPLREELPSLEWMIHEGATALLAAKADGRNCVRTLPFQPNRSGEAYPVNSR